MANTTTRKAVRRCADLVEREARRLASWQNDLFGPPAYEPPPTTHEYAEIARQLCSRSLDQVRA